jgi:CDP-diacylglycerol--glycerol-3-phosphate 3-phosphatidyltransferase
VRDLHFAWLLMGVLVSGVGGYALRSAVRGRLRHARTEADGGSVFVGKPAMEVAYWLIGPVVNAVAALGATPNGVTLFSLLPAAGAGIALGYGWFALAALLAAIAQFADIVDGLLARKLGTASDAGEALDAAVDRYVELFFLGGLAVHYRNHPTLLAVVVAALGGSFMVSYATAKAEALGVKAPRGVMRHGERVVYLLTAAAFTPFARELTSAGTSILLRELPIVLALTIVAVVANASVVRRFAAIIAALQVKQAVVAETAPTRPDLDVEARPAADRDVPLGSY